MIVNWFSLKLVKVRFDCCLVDLVFSVLRYGIVADRLFDIYTGPGEKKYNFVFHKASFTSIESEFEKCNRWIIPELITKFNCHILSNYKVMKLLDCTKKMTVAEIISENAIAQWVLPLKFSVYAKSVCIK